jgi:hypothetical protein
MKNWIKYLEPIITEYCKNREDDETLDGDEVDNLVNIIRAEINLNQGNTTELEYNVIMDNFKLLKILN